MSGRTMHRLSIAGFALAAAASSVGLIAARGRTGFIAVNSGLLVWSLCWLAFLLAAKRDA